MSLIKAKQLDILVSSLRKAPGAFTLAAANSATVTSAFTGKTAGGDNTTKGVITGAGNNRVALYRKDTGEVLSDDEGLPVYGRLTETAGVWTVNFFANDGAGSETAYTFAGEDSVGKEISLIYGEVIHIKDLNPLDIINGMDQIDETDFDPTKHTRFVQKYSGHSTNDTAFTLTHTPKDNNIVEMFVNGQLVSDRLTVVGTAATFNPADYPIEDDDSVIFAFDY